ncbi:MAG: putative RNA uridine N3 methyltransferase [Thermoproteota archaeon]
MVSGTYYTWPPPPREIKIHLVLPASYDSTEPTLQLKTAKWGIIGRVAAVFRVDSISIFVDKASSWRSAQLGESVLRYMWTAPYLRKFLFPKMPELAYAGILPPLQLPTHGVGGPKPGETRQALVRRVKGVVALLEAGLGREVEVQLPQGSRHIRRGTIVHVRIEEVDPPKLRIVDKPDVYTGFKVNIVRGGLKAVLMKFRKRGSSTVVLATDRKGEMLVPEDLRYLANRRRATEVAVIFGAPDLDLFELAALEGFKLEDYVDAVLNTVPWQGTLTVRVEEALAATLSLLNIALP